MFSSYTIVASMNAYPPQSRADEDRRIRASHNIGRTVLFVTRASELTDPGPSSRMVFLDHGYGWGWGWWGGDWGSVGVEWVATLHHSNGTCMSFADGHSEYRKWKDPRTVADGKAWLDYWDQYEAGTSPNLPVSLDPVNNEDYIRVHTAIWGKGPQ